MKNLLLTSFAKHNVCTNFWLCFQICFMVPDHKCSKCFGSSRWLNQDTPAPTICNIRLVVRLVTKILYGRCKQKAIVFKYFPVLKNIQNFICQKVHQRERTLLGTNIHMIVYDRVYACIYVLTCMCECIYVDIIV